MFTRLQEKENQFRSQHKIEPKTIYFSLYVLGLMLYGAGSYLFLNELLVSMMDVQGGLNLFYILGMGSMIVGIGSLIFLFYQFYKRVPSKQKIRLALRNYILLILVSGVVFGLLGEILYRMTAQSYDWVKTFIWILTTYIQGGARFVFLYYCLKIFQEEPINWKNAELKKMLQGIVLLLSISIGIHLISPLIGSMAMFVADLVIAIGIVYKELFRSKRMG